MFSLEEKEKGEKDDENITEKYEQDGESRSVENLHIFLFIVCYWYFTLLGPELLKHFVGYGKTFSYYTSEQVWGPSMVRLGGGGSSNNREKCYFS